MAILDDLEIAVRLFENRAFVSGVHRGQHSALQVQNAEPHGDEHFFVVAGAQRRVCGFQHVFRRFAHFGVAADRHLGGHHKQRGRHALVRYVRDHHAEVVVVHHEEIVEIAADLFRGGHGRIDIEFLPVRESRENTGQRAGLNAGRHIQFTADPLLFFFMFLFFGLLLQFPGLPLQQLPHDPRDQQKHCQPHSDPEYGLLVESLQLDDRNGSAAGPCRFALQLQVEGISAAPEVGIADLA